MKDNSQSVLSKVALVGLGISIGAFLVIVLINSNLIPIEIRVGPVSFGIPTSHPQTPIVQPQIPTSTSAPQGPHIQSLGTIQIFGNSNQGTQIQIPQSGIYRFAYKSGAYATYPIGGAPENTKTWLTSVFIFRLDRALWDGRRIKDESLFLRLADTKYWASAEEAEQSAQGQYVEAQLKQGEVLTLIAVDHFEAYADNPGQVVVEWFFVPY